jgi:hypothetical protein
MNKDKCDPGLLVRHKHFPGSIFQVKGPSPLSANAVDCLLYRGPGLHVSADGLLISRSSYQEWIGYYSSLELITVGELFHVESAV